MIKQNTLKKLLGIWAVLVLSTVASFVVSGDLVADEHAPSEKPKNSIEDAVVKIHVTQRPPDFIRPWTKGRPTPTSGTGVIISGNRILTNAHVALYASHLHVQAHQSSKRELAEIVAIAPEVDLAIITVKDPDFFKGRPTLELSTALPNLKETINVYGYPLGGEQISITEGIVSRIECTQIAFSGVGVRIQIDAALNPGNSGGPAIANDKIVGLAFSGVRVADNIGYVIAAEEVERFLNNVSDGNYLGKPAIYDRMQTAENESLRNLLKLDAEQGGLMVTQPYSDSEDYPIKKFDVIVKVGDYDVDRKGYVQIQDSLKLSYRYLIPKLTKGGLVPTTIVRGGVQHVVQIPVVTKRELLIPTLEGAYPSYFVFGPMLLTTPSQEFLSAIERATAGLASLDSPLADRRLDKPKFEGEELVILGNRLFTHATSEGYDDTTFGVVAQINDIRVKNLAHAATLLCEAKGDFITINLRGSATEFLTFDRQTLDLATEEILESEGIRSRCSKDLDAYFDE